MGRHSEQQLQLHQYSTVGDGVGGVFCARPLDVCFFLCRVPFRFRDARAPLFVLAPLVLTLFLTLLLALTPLLAATAASAFPSCEDTGAGVGSGSAGQLPEIYCSVLLSHTSSGMSPYKKLSSSCKRTGFDIFD